MGYLCTCARADRTSVSQERLGRLGSILVCEMGVMICAFYKRHGQGTFVCTCARAHRASVSRERLDRLCSNLVSGLWAMNYVLSTSHGWYISARAHVHTALLHLGNGLADCVHIWCLGWGLSTRCFHKSWVGCICTCARAHPFSMPRELLGALC